MKVLAYEVEKHEIEYFKRYSEELNIDITIVSDLLTLETVSLTKGYEYITINGLSQIDKVLFQKLEENGVKYVASRCVGYNHMDVNAAKELGIRLSHGTYSPNNVADFAVMLMLMLIRKVKISMGRSNVNDFSLNDLQGREMKDLTIGVIGTGKIGSTVVKNLSGFGCRTIVYARHPNENLKGIVEYVDLETIYRESDIITLHMSLTDGNYHIINKDTISRMKDGVIIINTARGGLVNTQDLIVGLETGKIGAAGIDTYEDEEGICHLNHNVSMVGNREMLYLKQFPNVILTQHYAFFTDHAVSDMVESSLCSLNVFSKGLSNECEIIV
ncbi:D-isomer specific 2-hydroxyacid dehydrogenase family protein [Clostridium saccharobutylicum]|uniref:Phenyllactate dehydrogenase n=1 Tax=Clostridium saccharobutylicum TaxID=169679 RepID=A0A1S8NDH3_CLOSA|nr:D-isomer specific 2-hydroxyacid dehydrogenase family protein [Clostridium saccharobutylicum]OOM14448.1 phenyllactate dehydrogenase [Clostridium saccharobutylicum]